MPASLSVIQLDYAVVSSFPDGPHESNDDCRILPTQHVELASMDDLMTKSGPVVKSPESFLIQS